MHTLQTKDLIGEGIEEQTEQALKNMGAILDAAGSSFSQVLKTTVLLTDMGDFASVNEVYGKSKFPTNQIRRPLVDAEQLSLT